VVSGRLLNQRVDMTGKSRIGHAEPMAGQDQSQPHRRRRRAARRAAGPPAGTDEVSGQPPAVSAPTNDGPQVPAVAARKAAEPAAGSPVETTPVPVAAAGTTTQPPPAEVHGSPGDAPEHAPAAAHSTGSHSVVASGGGAGKDREHAGGGSAGGDGRRTRSGREEAAERSLRSLVTTRSTQVSSTAALRAREVALPSDADLAAAELDLVIVRRHYVPPTTLTAGRRQDWSNRRTAGSKGGNTPTS